MKVGGDEKEKSGKNNLNKENSILEVQVKKYLFSVLLQKELYPF